LKSVLFLLRFKKLTFGARHNISFNINEKTKGQFSRDFHRIQGFFQRKFSFKALSTRLASSSDPGATGDFSAVALVIQ